MQQKISPFHIAVLTYMAQAGMVLFTLPRSLADYFGTNGWLVLIPCFLLSAFNIWLISLVFRLGQGRSVFAILEQSVPKMLLYPLYFLLAGSWLIFGCMIGKKYVLVFQMLSFPSTNPMLFKLAIDVLAFLLLIKGIQGISKAATLFFWMTAWMILLLAWFIPSFRWERLTPFLLKGGHDQVKGSIEVYSAFLGYELTLFLFPHVKKNKKSIWAIDVGNLFLMLNYLSLSLICFGLFSLNQLKKLLYPVLDLLAYIQFPFIERLENLLYGFFLFLILITLVMYWWAAQLTVQRMMPKLNMKILLLILIFIAYGISFFAETLEQVNVWITNLGYAVTGIAFGLPTLLIMILLLQRKGGTTHG